MPKNNIESALLGKTITKIEPTHQGYILTFKDKDKTINLCLEIGDSDPTDPYISVELKEK
jgi:hypothetical protein